MLQCVKLMDNIQYTNETNAADLCSNMQFNTVEQFKCKYVKHDASIFP